MPVAETIAIVGAVVAATGSAIKTYKAAKETKITNFGSSKVGSSAPSNMRFGQGDGTFSFQIR